MISLNKYETAILLATKNHHLPDYNGKAYFWEKNLEESILTGYDNIVNIFLKIVCVKQDAVQLENINMWMVNVLEKLEPTSLKSVIRKLQSHRYVGSTGYGMNRTLTLSHSPTQAVFLELYASLQGIQVMETGNDGENYRLFHYDDSLFEKNKGKNN